MIVEDSHAVRAVWRRMVAGISGLLVASDFSCVSKAIDGMHADPPEIILLDIEINGESGMAVLREAAERYPSTKVIVVTNYADAVYRKHYLDAGAHAFFDKSHDIKKLHETLDKLACSRVTALSR